MTVSYALQEEDIHAMFQFFNAKTERGKANQKRTRWILSSFMAFVSWCLAALLSSLLPGSGFYHPLLVPPLAFLGFYFYFPRQQKEAVRTEVTTNLKSGAFNDLLVARTLEVSAEGLRQRSAFGERVVYWSAVRRVEEYEGNLLLEVPGNEFFLVPPRAFADPQHQAQFVATIERYRQGQASTTAEPLRQSWYQSKDQVG
jgi:YcxB-like protein